jgi:O-antigen/teichoic acid export membrane protein
MLKRPIVNTGFQILGKVVTVGLSLVTTAVLTRKLGSSAYGNYLLITSVWLLLDAAADFGSRVIGVREAATEVGEKRNWVYVQIAWFRLAAALVGLVIGLGIIWWWSGFDGIEMEALVALLMIGLTSMAGSLEIIFQTEMKMGRKVWMDILFPLLFTVALLTTKEINLLWVCGMYLLARAVSLGVGLGLVGKIVGKIKLWRPDIKYLNKFIKLTWPMGLYMILFSGYDRAIDSALIKGLIGAGDLAFYGLAYKIYGNLVQPAYFLINSVFPLMSRKDGNKKSLFWQTAGLMLMGAVMVGLVTYGLAPWIIKVLGGEGYEPAIRVLRILILAMVASYMGHLVGFTLIAKGGQKQMLMIGISSLTINIVGNLIFIPRLGINGAAWVTVATETVACLLMMGFLKRDLR